MCPACNREVDQDMTDSAGRMWHANCAREKLTTVSTDVIAACPECGQLVQAGDVAVYDMRHRRKWHPECVPKALGKLC